MQTPLPRRPPAAARSGIGDDAAAGEGGFVCERVCTSDRLLRRLGKLAKDPTHNSCITVCGVSGAAAGLMGRWPRVRRARMRRRSGCSATAPPNPSNPLVAPPGHDACVEACQRSVCSIPHQVPAWNESCLKRCTSECMKGRAA
jgi:hypothetical protein